LLDPRDKCLKLVGSCLIDFLARCPGVEVLLKLLHHAEAALDGIRRPATLLQEGLESFLIHYHAFLLLASGFLEKPGCQAVSACSF
jgi:hypothetical protein